MAIQLINPPTEGTQCDALLKHFQAGGSVNYLTAMMQFHIGSGFTRRIADLKAAGYNIIFDRRKSKINRAYQEYYLEEFKAKHDPPLNKSNNTDSEAA